MIWAMHGLTFFLFLRHLSKLKDAPVRQTRQAMGGNAWMWLISAVVHELSSIFSIFLCREVLHLRRIQEHTPLCIAAPRDTGSRRVRRVQ